MLYHCPFTQFNHAFILHLYLLQKSWRGWSWSGRHLRLPLKRRNLKRGSMESVACSTKPASLKCLSQIQKVLQTQTVQPSACSSFVVLTSLKWLLNLWYASVSSMTRVWSHILLYNRTMQLEILTHLLYSSFTYGLSRWNKQQLVLSFEFPLQKTDGINEVWHSAGWLVIVKRVFSQAALQLCKR